MTIRPEPCERIVFHSGELVLGEFRCPVSYRNFSRAGQIVNFVLGFPRAAVWVQHEDAPRFVADPSLATLYNRHQPYLREPISPNGDESDWLALSDGLARDAVRHFSPSDADAAEPFRYRRARVSQRVYLSQRSLFIAVREGLRDRLEIEERALQVIGAVLASAYHEGRKRATGGARTRELVEQARETIMSTLFDNLGVADIAARLEISPFHLCRSFRAVTGMTLHTYRRDMRLRAALGYVPEHRGHLSALAVRVGFYSHSHFTAAFRQAFGIAPSHEMIAPRTNVN